MTHRSVVARLFCDISIDNMNPQTYKSINGSTVPVNQVMTDDGSLVWMEVGLNPDHIFANTRLTKYPFSQVIADIICEKIALGSVLTKVCKTVGFPSYNVVCQWRRQNSQFNEALKNAYEDRQQYFEEQILELARSGGSALMIKTLRWIVERVRGKTGISEISQRKNAVVTWILKSSIPGRADIVCRTPISAIKPTDP